MKKVFVFMLIAFSGISFVLAQDKITLLSGEEINGKIIRLNQNDIYYFPKGSPDTIVLQRIDVLKLQYQSGTIVFLNEDTRTSEQLVTQNDSMYFAGTADASKYYQGYYGASTGTLVAGLIFPWNLIPAIACSATPPSAANLDYPSPKLMENQSYSLGYKNQAHAIKKKKVWNSFAIGSAVMVAIYIILGVAASNSN
jgi:hypothetical protein